MVFMGADEKVRPPQRRAEAYMRAKIGPIHEE
jgi:hypothetical protein